MSGKFGSSAKFARIPICLRSVANGPHLRREPAGGHAAEMGILAECGFWRSSMASPASPPGRARGRQNIPLYVVPPGRISLPPPAHLLRICRTRRCPARPLGRRVDDPGAARALPSMGNRRPRHRGRGGTRPGPLVPAVALRGLARGQPTRRSLRGRRPPGTATAGWPKGLTNLPWRFSWPVAAAPLAAAPASPRSR